MDVRQSDFKLETVNMYNITIVIDYLLLNPLALVITISLGLMLLVYLYLTRNFGKFEAKGLYSVKPNVLFGNIKDIILQKTSPYDHVLEFYRAFGDHKIGIYYEGDEPIIYVKDLDLIKQIMITDFEHFTDFGFFKHEITDMKGNDLGLLSKRGDEWRTLKHILSPALNLKNLPNSTEMMSEIAQNLIEKLLETKGKQILVMETLSGYVVDSFLRVFFSLHVDAVGNPDNEFSKHANFFPPLWRHALASFSPTIMRLLNISYFDFRATNYFTKVSEKIMKDRRLVKTDLNDTLTLMMKAIDRKADQNGNRELKKADFTDEFIARTIMQFFLDNETVTGILSLSLYFLAINLEVQDKAMSEVDGFSDLHEELSSTNVGDLKYLDQVFSETARMSGIPETRRTCTKPWTIPGTDVTIPSGMRVLIPIHAIHMDDKHFAHAKEFNPDRFSPENKSQIPSGCYMPFGQGPRMCVDFGIQFARMEAKVVLYHILKKFHVEIGDQAPIPLKWNKDGILRLEGGNWVKFIPRD